MPHLQNIILFSLYNMWFYSKITKKKSILGESLIYVTHLSYGSVRENKHCADNPLKAYNRHNKSTMGGVAVFKFSESYEIILFS